MSAIEVKAVDTDTAVPSRVEGRRRDSQFDHESENGDLDFDRKSESTQKEDEEAISSETDAGPLQLEVPDGGYGWVIVLACFFFNISTWGSNAGYAIYLAHYLNNNTFPGATKIDFGIVGGIVFGCGLPLAPLYNYMVGRIGLKSVIVIGITIQLAGTLLASFSTKYWQILLTQGACEGVGMSMVALTNVNLLPQWFRKKRSTAIGFAAAGSGMGGIIFNLPMQQIINKHGFRWSLRVQAIMCASLSVIGLFLARSREKHIRPVYKIYDRQVWRCFGIWLEVIYLMLTMLGYVVLMYNLADFTRSLGYTAQQGSVVSTMVSVGSLTIRPFCGRILDYYGPVNVSIFLHAIVGVFAIAMWIPIRNLASAIIFAFIEGGMMGTLWIAMPPVTAKIVGLRKMGVGLAVNWIFLGVAGFVSPIIGIDLKSKDIDGHSFPAQYRNPAIFVGCVYFGSAIALLIMRGWIIARSKLADERFGAREEDQDSLEISVPPMATMRNLFTMYGKI
ncbi:unnamed protein product [Kuraishia capsulata CBS 1993]|uniref:Major facilitator superfamily (MFS) profile domain-containing protein n=1 Tax=Kuraishia capsulata CBS 1993 TaxID=1382522 RepID=W6MR55_9ASCO|nr:uncharacterized protein KUCA_T00005183001 [Kuraishia capsulata CBS 1993]CDK29196.1 unnamed protein product [Kuraishia capsulata CBS 1993]